MDVTAGWVCSAPAWLRDLPRLWAAPFGLFQTGRAHLGTGSAAVGLGKNHSSCTTAAESRGTTLFSKKIRKMISQLYGNIFNVRLLFSSPLRAIRECAYEISSAFIVYCLTGFFYCPSLLWIAHLYLYNSSRFYTFPHPRVGVSVLQKYSVLLLGHLYQMHFFISVKWNEHLKTLLFTAKRTFPPNMTRATT